MDDEALAAEQQLSANLAAAATTLKYRAQATKTLLTLELIHADGELSAAHSASSYYAAQNSQLVAHCSLLEAQLAEATSVLFGAEAALGGEIAGLEALVASAAAAEERTATSAQSQLDALREQITTDFDEAARARDELTTKKEQLAARVQLLEGELSESRARLRATGERVTVLAGECDDAQRRAAAATRQREAERQAVDAMANKLTDATSELRAAAGSRLGALFWPQLQPQPHGWERTTTTVGPMLLRLLLTTTKTRRRLRAALGSGFKARLPARVVRLRRRSVHCDWPRRRSGGSRRRPRQLPRVSSRWPRTSVVRRETRSSRSSTRRRVA